MRFGNGVGIGELFFVLLWAAFVVLVLVLIVLAIRWLLRSERSPGPPSESPSASPPGPDPLAILRERYARGEIDDEEFERRRKTLGG